MADATERSFIMIKPDGVQRGLVGDIIRRFEQRGYKLVALKLIQVRFSSNRVSIVNTNDFLFRPHVLYSKATTKNTKARNSTNHSYLTSAVAQLLLWYDGALRTFF